MDINNMDVPLQIKAVQQNVYIFSFINRPSEAVQVATARKNGLVLQHFNRPSEAVQLEAVQQNGEAIQFADKGWVERTLVSKGFNSEAVENFFRVMEAKQYHLATALLCE